MSLPDKAFPVSWDQFHRDARALAWRLAGINSGSGLLWMKTWRGFDGDRIQFPFEHFFITIQTGITP